MLDVVSEMLSYPFITRAVIVGVIVALCASLLGVSLTLKRYSMIGDGLSHVGFGALTVAAAMNLAPLAVAVPVVVAAAFLLLRLSESTKVKADAAIALISCGSLGVGVMIISLSDAGNVDLTNYMFGSILAISRTDMILSIALSLIVIAIYVFFYARIFAITFDENFAKATGVRVELFNVLIALLTAVTVVIGMRLVGSMLISALIIFPPLSSMRIFKSFRSVVISSAILSVVCFLVGIVASYAFSAPAGASVVCVNAVAYLLFLLAGKVKR